MRKKYYQLQRRMIIFMSIEFILLGICISQIYNIYHPQTIVVQNRTFIEDCSTQAKIMGIWLPDIKHLSNYTGKYICINIKETTTLTELERVCNHEIGHEIFARECESNFTKCLESEDK